MPQPHKLMWGRTLLQTSIIRSIRPIHFSIGARHKRPDSGLPNVTRTKALASSGCSPMALAKGLVGSGRPNRKGTVYCGRGSLPPSHTRSCSHAVAPPPLRVCSCTMAHCAREEGCPVPSLPSPPPHCMRRGYNRIGGWYTGDTTDRVIPTLLAVADPLPHAHSLSHTWVP